MRNNFVLMDKARSQAAAGFALSFLEVKSTTVTFCPCESHLELQKQLNCNLKCCEKNNDIYLNKFPHILESFNIKSRG